MDFNFLSKTVLFRGMTGTDIENMLDRLGAKQRHFSKGDIIFQAGDVIRSLGLVLSGHVNIENDDIWGNKSILDNIGPGQVFAETYACIPGEPMMVSVVASEAVDVLFLNVGQGIQNSSGENPGWGRLIQNLLAVSAQKNLNLSRRIFHTSPKSIRGRLLSYLSYQAARQRSLQFTIPFNRQQLADYLSVDRSAMSNELSKMQREGLLTVNRNYFVLKVEASDYGLI
ncbi:cyclic nucleotide-binding domain-containing protein [Frisingicoccus sp.]|uniref:Crp/Fnr family transcriptional regulator n=1 Tax=Frisingicoccus sp. TaxID=1918627 RepID=UPI0015BF6203